MAGLQLLRAIEQALQVDAQRFGDGQQRAQAWIGLAEFHLLECAHGEASTVRDVFLGGIRAQRFATLPNGFTQRAQEPIGRSHARIVWKRRLLDHVLYFTNFTSLWRGHESVYRRA